MENNNFACRLPDVNNVTKKEDAWFKYSPGSPNFMEYMDVNNVMKKGDARLKYGPGSPNFMQNMRKMAMALRSKAPKSRHQFRWVSIDSIKRRQSKQREMAMALRSKAPKSRHPEKVVAIDSIKRRQSKPKKPMFKKDVVKGTDSDTTSKDEEWDYHLAKKKWDDAHLKDVAFSDVCETKQPCGGLDSPHYPATLIDPLAGLAVCED